MMRLVLFATLSLPTLAAAFSLPKLSGSKNPPALENRLACLAGLGEITPGEESTEMGGLAQRAKEQFIMVTDPRPSANPNSRTVFVVAGKPGNFDGEKVELSHAQHKIWKVTLQSADRKDLDVTVKSVGSRKGAGFEIFGPKKQSKAPSIIYTYPSDRVQLNKYDGGLATLSLSWEKEEIASELKAQLKPELADRAKPQYRRRLFLNDPHEPPALRGVNPLDPRKEADLAVIQDAMTNVLIPDALARIPSVYTHHLQGEVPMPLNEIYRALMKCEDIGALRQAAQIEAAKFKAANDNNSADNRLLNDILTPHGP